MDIWLNWLSSLRGCDYLEIITFFFNSAVLVNNLTSLPPTTLDSWGCFICLYLL